jgi:hypothetical protein
MPDKKTLLVYLAGHIHCDRRKRRGLSASAPDGAPSAGALFDP